MSTGAHLFFLLIAVQKWDAIKSKDGCQKSFSFTFWALKSTWKLYQSKVLYSFLNISNKCTHRWPDSDSFQDWNCSILAWCLFTRGYGEFAGCQWTQWSWSCEKFLQEIENRIVESHYNYCYLILDEMVLCYKLCSLGAECWHHVFISWGRNLQYLNFQRA